ncbi:MAG: TMEM165/GDT1 family protein [Deltaproteobacteria bacterium]|uniref:GDT1 family protein n=1 Tax=Candidatus Zymogenus saltonus TaxID=2844893 RepID=A0A9D8PNR4_9DELT|nr:TMEM165/GDT1 family protein [Candidatus Zymogenus saltonus]
MDLKLFFTVFGTIFLAELGDKTQLAVMALAAENHKGLLSIFLGSVLALALTSLIGVLLGGVIAKYVSASIIQYVAGGLFVVVGILIIVGKF